MSELLTAAQMRAIEAAAIGSGEVTGLELMERAGRGVCDAVFAQWPEMAAVAHRAVVLTGPGNNGGDGFVVARLLLERGWEVAVFLLGDPARLPPDAQANYARWGGMGTVQALSAYPEDDRGFDLYVDALFGTGLTRPLTGDAARILSGYAASSHYEQRLVCVDIQSGICADSGEVLGGGERPAAALTVTFHRAKLGHFLSGGPDRAGKLVVVDIGLSDTSRQTSAPEGGGVVHLVDAPDEAGAARLRKGRCPSAAHKYTHGHALVLSGPMGRSGAARLAARGALRVGAGVVTVAAPGSALMECAAHLTAIMVRKCDGAGGLSALLEDKRLKALCLGPGLGVEQGTRDLVETALAARRALVLDADALTSFEAVPEALFARLHEACVLTPHGGEFARLFPDIGEKRAAVPSEGPAFSKVDAARAAAVQAGCVVLLKGADTVIAGPDGRCSVSSAHYGRAAPWLATAGSGDVLAGVISGLMARGFGAFEAAATAAWLHVECARRFGPGLIAEDLPEMLPTVLGELDP